MLTDAPESGLRIIGTDTYEWLAGGFFLVHWVDVRVGDDRVEALEIIGYDPASDTYPARSFDNHGNEGTMTASVDEAGVWTFSDQSARATLETGGDTMHARWERSVDGAWRPWMELAFTRAGEGPGGSGRSSRYGVSVRGQPHLHSA